jgi:hypothetical protein
VEALFRDGHPGMGSVRSLAWDVCFYVVFGLQSNSSNPLYTIGSGQAGFTHALKARPKTRSWQGVLESPGSVALW